jgi:hypothetical protein
MADKKFRREDIPGIVPELPDMVTPEGAAAALRVTMSKLRARQVIDKSRPVGAQTINDFFTKTLFEGMDVHMSPAH